MCGGGITASTIEEKHIKHLDQEIKKVVGGEEGGELKRHHELVSHSQWNGMRIAFNHQLHFISIPVVMRNHPPRGDNSLFFFPCSVSHEDPKKVSLLFVF